jgi:hypothetical protein
MLTALHNAPHVVTPDPAIVKSGDESGMTRFCEEAYISPESALAGSQALIASFNDSGLWLSSLVQPAHLVAELRQQSSLLTRVVVTQWTRQGETQKLVRLAEALIGALPPVQSHEAGQIMALLAGLLGILRPAMAPRWLAASRPLLRDSVDLNLFKDSAMWVGIGQILATLPQEDRLFWNRRLRDPGDGWDWDCPEALDALRRLAPLLPGDSDAMLLIQSTVPRSWWELWSEQQARLSSSTAVASPNNRSNTLSASVLAAFCFGMGTGILCMMLAGWWASKHPPAASPPASTASPTSETANFSFHAVQGSAVPAAKPATAVNRSEKSRPAIQPATTSSDLSPAAQARMGEAARIAEAMPQLTRLHSLVKNGNVSESIAYLQGKAAMVTQSSKEHRALLRWLMLDPPLDGQVRVQVAKAALRILSAKEMYQALMRCLHPGSPNLLEARESASLLLALSSQNLTRAEISSLKKAAEIK